MKIVVYFSEVCVARVIGNCGYRNGSLWVVLCPPPTFLHVTEDINRQSLT